MKKRLQGRARDMRITRNIRFARRLSCILCLPLLIICSTLAELSADDRSAIYVVDVRTIAAQSIAGKALKNSMEGEMKKSEAKIRPLQSQVQGDRQAMEKQSGILSEQAIQEKRLALAKKEQALRKAVEEEQKRVAELSQEKTKKFRKQLNEVMEDLADDRGISFLVEKDPQMVLYVDPKYDLTKDVLQAMNKVSMNN